MPRKLTTEEAVARHLAANDYLVPGDTADDAWWNSRLPKFRDDYLRYAREVIAIIRTHETPA